MSSDSELRQIERERDDLTRVLASVEIAMAASIPASGGFFANFLGNARSRIGELEKKISDAQAAVLRSEQAEITAVRLAQQETALSRREQEAYSGFLSESHFTKSDFVKLEEFYSNAWSRLSERGKNEMSHRVWEGVRKEEYKFSDLPKVVQEKEEDRAYAILKKRETEVGAPGRIPDGDREDFFRAYEGGKRKEAGVILDRPSFRRNMFLGKDSAPIHSMEAEVGGEAQATRVRDNSAVSPAAPDSKVRSQQTPGANANLDVSGLRLDGMELAALPPEISSASLPKAGAPKSRDSELSRGS